MVRGFFFGRSAPIPGPSPKRGKGVIWEVDISDCHQGLHLTPTNEMESLSPSPPLFKISPNKVSRFFINKI